MDNGPDTDGDRVDDDCDVDDDNDGYATPKTRFHLIRSVFTHGGRIS